MFFRNQKTKSQSKNSIFFFTFNVGKATVLLKPSSDLFRRSFASMHAGTTEPDFHFHEKNYSS